MIVREFRLIGFLTKILIMLAEWIAELVVICKDYNYIYNLITLHYRDNRQTINLASKNTRCHYLAAYAELGVPNHGFY